MTPKEAFRLGFLTRCAEMSLSSEETNKLAKRASDLFLTKTAGPIADTVKSVGWPLMLAGLSAPVLAGSGAAYFQNKALDTDEADIDEIKKKELIETYQRMSEQLARKRRIREVRHNHKPSGRVLL